MNVNFIAKNRIQGFLLGLSFSMSLLIVICCRKLSFWKLCVGFFMLVRGLTMNLVVLGRDLVTFALVCPRKPIIRTLHDTACTAPVRPLSQLSSVLISGVCESRVPLYAPRLISMFFSAPFDWTFVSLPLFFLEQNCSLQFFCINLSPVSPKNIFSKFDRKQYASCEGDIILVVSSFSSYLASPDFDVRWLVVTNSELFWSRFLWCHSYQEDVAAAWEEQPKGRQHGDPYSLNPETSERKCNGLRHASAVCHHSHLSMELRRSAEACETGAHGWILQWGETSHQCDYSENIQWECDINRFRVFGEGSWCGHPAWDSTAPAFGCGFDHFEGSSGKGCR